MKKEEEEEKKVVCFPHSNRLMQFDKQGQRCCWFAVQIQLFSMSV